MDAMDSFIQKLDFFIQTWTLLIGFGVTWLGCKWVGFGLKDSSGTTGDCVCGTIVVFAGVVLMQMGIYHFLQDFAESVGRL